MLPIIDECKPFKFVITNDKFVFHHVLSAFMLALKSLYYFLPFIAYTMLHFLVFCNDLVGKISFIVKKKYFFYFNTLKLLYLNSVHILKVNNLIVIRILLPILGIT